MLGSLPPEELELRLGSVVNTPATEAAVFVRTEHGEATRER
jgi:hypothetical protein